MNWADPETLMPHEGRVTLRKAAELQLLPRVTGIIEDMMGAGRGLQAYYHRQDILSAEKTLRREGETDTDYVARVRSLAAQHAAQARDRGKVVHKLVADFLEGTVDLDADTAASDICLNVKGAVLASKGTPYPELLVTNNLWAGQTDLFIDDADLWALAVAVDCLIPDGYDLEGHRAIVDIKTTSLQKFTKPYREHPLQLGAYAEAKGLGRGDLLLSCYADPWTGICRWEAYPDVDRWTQAFRCLYMAWEHEHDWDRLKQDMAYWC